MKKKSRGKIVNRGMNRIGTPVEDRRDECGLWVKREDLSCPPPGPPFSKTRGVYLRVQKVAREQRHSCIGVLDTYHSQAGHAVARACSLLGMPCINFYPEYKNDPGYREPQERAKNLGAELVGLKAGRSCILFHQARHITESQGGYMMPNALKLEESISETAAEVGRTPEIRKMRRVIVPSSSGTIAAGVLLGLHRMEALKTELVIHLGYSRSHEAVLSYVQNESGVHYLRDNLTIIDEGYSYKDQARRGPTPDWPCNPYYDLKAYRWWVNNDYPGETLLWNIG